MIPIVTAFTGLFTLAAIEAPLTAVLGVIGALRPDLRPVIVYRWERDE